MLSRTSTAGRFVLRPPVLISLTLSAPHDPDAYYRTRTGLYVGSDFHNRVVKSAKPAAAEATFNLNRSDLGQGATDEEIEAALPKDHLFDESALCAIVAELISTQQNGEAGHLRNNGHANLLYTSTCVVHVYWSAGDRLWDVETWRRDGSRWLAGSRVLSPAN